MEKLQVHSRLQAALLVREEEITNNESKRVRNRLKGTSK